MRITTIHNSLLQSCSYLLEESGLILIDCGDVDKIISEIEQIAKILDGILLTHCHQDHIYGLSELLNRYPLLQIYCSELTAKGLSDEQMNLSYIMPDYRISFHHFDNIVTLQEGKQVINGIEIDVFATPGHSDDCLTYIIGNNIFTGDSYIPFAKVFTKWPRSNKTTALMNEHKIKQIVDDNKLNVYSGHWQ